MKVYPDISKGLSLGKEAMTKQYVETHEDFARFVEELWAARRTGRIKPSDANRLLAQVQARLRRDGFNQELHEGNPHYGLKVV